MRTPLGLRNSTYGLTIGRRADEGGSSAHDQASEKRPVAHTALHLMVFGWNIAYQHPIFKER
jgi:hypothetical protein